MKEILSITNIEKAKQAFVENEHFSHIIYPRLKALLAIKKELKDIVDLDWNFNYDHVNQHNNAVNIEFIPSQSSEFNFFFQITLKQGFEFRLFLGTSSVHFIDLYNYLINQKLIVKDEFPIKAEYRTIPHFILNKNVKRYQMKVLSAMKQENAPTDLKDEAILEVILEGIQHFLPLLHKILKA